MFSTFVNATFLCFLASCKSEPKKIFVQVCLLLCKSILGFEKCKSAPYRIVEISPLVFPKPGVICCFIVS